MPATQPVARNEVSLYGPDLPPAPAPPSGAFDEKNEAIAGKDSIFALSTAFPHGAELRHGAADGARIYQDEKEEFKDLPSYLKGADYLLVANADASASAGEGVVFKISRPGRVLVAYDDRNSRFPVISSPTPFFLTSDKLIIDGHPHTIYASGVMNGGELNYLGTNSWTDQPPAGTNNYVVFIQTNPDAPVPPLIKK